jgi:hypothetical protein
MRWILNLLLLIVPTLIYGQSALADHYVDDRINEDTYLRFNADSSFKFQYAYDLLSDHAAGRYRRHGDTLFLTYTTDTTTIKRDNIWPNADSLIIKGYFLYQIKNGQSREYEPQEIVHHKMPKNEHYKRKFILFGPWHSTWSQYYMVDEKYAKWKKWRSRADIK